MQPSRSPATTPVPQTTSFSPSVWKRFQNGLDAPIPLLALDVEGSIVQMSPAARALLDYGPDAAPDACFFTHVHGRNLQVVMRDLAHMVCRRKRKASWLLRMRTGNGRWIWVRATVRPTFDTTPPRILVRLRKV